MNILSEILAFPYLFSQNCKIFLMSASHGLRERIRQTVVKKVKIYFLLHLWDLNLKFLCELWCYLPKKYYIFDNVCGLRVQLCAWNVLLTLFLEFSAKVPKILAKNGR